MNLKKLRNENNLTLDQLSKEVEISNPLLSNYEQGKVNPPIKNLFKLADYFGVSIDYLLGHEVNKNNLKNQTFEKKQSIFIRLKDLRSELNLTQEQLAQAVGLSRDTYKNYEQQRTEMSYDILFKLADYFGVSIDYLLGHQTKETVLDKNIFEGQHESEPPKIKLKDLRKKRGLSQREIAERLNLTKTTYARYEIGESEPNVDTMIKLADYFGVSIDYLIDHQTEGSNMSESQKEIVEDFKKLISQLTTQQTSFVFDIIKLCLNSPMYKQTL